MLPVRARRWISRRIRLLPNSKPMMPQPMTIRDATAADVDLLAGFAAAMAWETERKRLDPATVQRGVAAVLATPQRGRYFVAEREGQVIGTLMLTFEWSDWRAADWWWIQSVFVVEAARR